MQPHPLRPLGAEAGSRSGANPVFLFAPLGEFVLGRFLQEDGEGRLWLIVHIGSRAMGPAIRDHHLDQAQPVGSGLRALEAGETHGQAYLQDAKWARTFAAANRATIAENIGAVLAAVLGAKLQWDKAITTDHNHVLQETHGDATLWVHRKGAIGAAEGQWGAPWVP